MQKFGLKGVKIYVIINKYIFNLWNEDELFFVKKIDYMVDENIYKIK